MLGTGIPDLVSLAGVVGAFTVLFAFFLGNDLSESLWNAMVSTAIIYAVGHVLFGI